MLEDEDINDRSDLRPQTEPVILKSDDFSFEGDCDEIWGEGDLEDIELIKAGCLDDLRDSFNCYIYLKIKKDRWVSIPHFNYVYDKEDFENFLNSFKTKKYISYHSLGNDYYYWIDRNSNKLYISDFLKSKTGECENSNSGLYICVPLDSFIEKLNAQYEELKNNINLYKESQKIQIRRMLESRDSFD